jgi:hypothetical protein
LSRQRKTITPQLINRNYHDELWLSSGVADLFFPIFFDLGAKGHW